MSNSTHCAQCDRPIDGPDQKFCPWCSQPTPAHRIDWEFLLHEIQHSIFHVDRGILFTIKHLLTRPGHMIREYIQGKRGGHFKPVLMIMLLGAVITIASKYWLGEGAFDGMVRINPGSPEAIKDASKVIDAMGFEQAAKHVMQWMSDHYAIVTLLILPFEALGFKLAFRRFRELNYPEWLVITTFLTAQAFVIQIVGIFIRKWVPDIDGIITAIVVLANMLTLVQFFKGETRWKIFLRSVWGFTLFMLCQGLFMAVGIFLLIWRYKA